MIQARSELLRRERLKSQLLSTISPIVKEGGGKSLGSMENKKKSRMPSGTSNRPFFFLLEASRTWYDNRKGI